MDYPWLAEDYSGIKEPEPLPGGSEVEVEIMKVTIREEKQDVLVGIKVTDTGVLGVAAPSVPLLNYYFGAAQRDDPNSEALRQLGNKRFLEGFNISITDQVDPNIWVGKNAWNILKLNPAKDPYPAQNGLGQFVTK